MTARYNSSDNTLKEISQMEKPLIHPSDYEIGSYFYQKAYSYWEGYHDHIAQLRTLSCHDSCRGLWKDNDVLTEDKDYKVYEYEGRPIIAYPVMTESEEKEMWMDAITLAMNALADDHFTPGKWLEVVKSKYTITRKQ